MRRGLVFLVLLLFVVPPVTRAQVRSPVPISIIRIGEEFFAPTPPRRITEGEPVKSFAYSPSGNQIAFLSTGRFPRDLDLAQVQQSLEQWFEVMMRGNIGVTDVRTGATRALLALPVRDRALTSYVFSADNPLAWSADSRWLAVPLSFIDLENPDPSAGPFGRDLRIVIIHVGRQETRWLRAAVPPAGLHGQGSAQYFEEVTEHVLDWHPTRPVLAYARPEGDEKIVTLWDAATGVTRTLTPGVAPRWSADGSTLEYFRYERVKVTYPPGSEVPQLSEFLYRVEPATLEMGPVPQISPPARPRPADDPKGRWVVKGDLPRFAGAEPAALVVTDQETERETVVARPGPTGKPRPLEWSADGALLLYTLTTEVTDRLRGRAKGFLQHLWVFNAGDRTPDCTAYLGSITWLHPEDLFRAMEYLSPPYLPPAAWSPTKRQVAYVNMGDLWVTDLAPAGPMGQPTLTLGMPEREAMSVALRRVGAVGRAALAYARDHDGELPPAETFDGALLSYLDDPNVLYLPTQPGVLGITWLAPAGLNLNELSPDDAKATPVAAMHWPPGYVAVTYADGHSSLHGAEDWAEEQND